MIFQCYPTIPTALSEFKWFPVMDFLFSLFVVFNIFDGISKDMIRFEIEYSTNKSNQIGKKCERIIRISDIPDNTTIYMWNKFKLVAP